MATKSRNARSTVRKTAKTRRTPRKTSSSRTSTTQTKASSASSASRSQSGASKGKAGIRVRMYRVGFGDFFLVTLKTKDGEKHILIDCGVHAGDLKSIGAAVDDMAKVTNNTLALVIMTHRHADHISGFARCQDAFAKFTVGRVWMSWFENPSDHVAVAFQANLVAVANKLQTAFAARTDPDAKQYREMAENITGDTLGAAGSSNDVALKVLHGGFKNQAPVDYYQAGDTPTLPQELVGAGLTADILGPPIDPKLIAQMDNKNHQYLASEGEDDGSPSGLAFDRSYCAAAALYPQDAFAPGKPVDIEKLVADVQPDLAAAKAKQADNTLNNQSLVVLFTFNGKTMLFVGDAQWGNWENFLFGGAVGSSAKLTKKSSDILGGVDFYKVGHHGSTNATPVDALNALRDGCVAMCSTQPGCYGKETSGTEVPRAPLLDALEKKTNRQLARSDQVDVDGTPRTKGLEDLASVFDSPGDKLFIDYEF